eukprot:gene14179-19027_t
MEEGLSETCWIFVTKNDGLYACEKRTSDLRFHHSSFFGGENVSSAGMIVCFDGFMIILYPYSCHYRPKDRNLCSLLKFLLRKSIPIANILVDAQCVFKCSRQSDGKGTH